MSENKLPNGVVDELLNYLNLEFGNDYPENSLSVEDLEYQGEKEIKGGVLHYWNIPTLKDDLLATVVVAADGSFNYAMEEKPYDSKIYDYLYMEIKGPGGIKRKLPFQDMPEYKLASSGVVELVFAKDKVVAISSEVCFLPNPPQVKIQLAFEEESFSFQSGLGIVATFSLGAEHTIFIEVGNLDHYWE